MERRRAVGNVKNDSPELIAPVSLPPHNLEDALRIGLDRSSPKVNSCETDPAEALEILNTQDWNDPKKP
jgi:hypothetical protein